MSGSGSDRSTTRSTTVEDLLIRRIVENVLTNPIFLDNITSVIGESLRKRDEDIDEYQARAVLLQKKYDEMTNTIEEQEQYSRSSNLRIFGLHEDEDEDLEERLLSLFQYRLEVVIKKQDIDYCHRLPHRRGQHPPVIVRFVRRSGKDGKGADSPGWES
ncbi:hypothetical protein Trydic_g13350 [Trypoxylus dichotomus]